MRSLKKSRIISLYCITLALLLFGAIAPQMYMDSMEEDFIGEWITFYAFLFAGINVLWYLWDKRKERPELTYVLAALLLAAFCLVVAGEETSWGQRVFAFKPPDFFLEANYQQEFNLHNLFKGDGFAGIKVESKHMVMGICLVYGMLLPLVVPFRSKIFKGINQAAPPAYMIPLFALILFMEIYYPITLTGEGCELLMGLLFLVHTYDAYPVKKAKLSSIGFLVVALGITTAPMFSLLVYGSAEDSKQKTKTEIALFAKDFIRSDTSKMMSRSKIHKRVYTAIKQGYFVLPEKDTQFLTDIPRKMYFVDPWNNPYWIYFSTKRRVIVIYSFGPNRRRDGDLDVIDKMAGDDVGFIMPLIPKTG